MIFYHIFPKPLTKLKSTVSIILIQGMEQPGYVQFLLLKPQNFLNTGFTDDSLRKTLPLKHSQGLCEGM